MKSKGHCLTVISRNKEIEHDLLRAFDIPFIDRGKGSTHFIGKFFYFFKAIYIIYKLTKKNKPDILLSFGTPYPAIVAWMLKIPHLSFNDTEYAKLHHLLTDTFSKNIITPSCYKENLGKKQVLFNGYFELCYLLPKYFTPNPSVLKLLNLEGSEKFVILRFVSWNAVHDAGHKGLTLEMKRRVIFELSKYAKVFITSESKLPEEFEPYRMNIPVDKMHDALYYASLLFGESATMASESAVLGNYSIFINKISFGYTEELQNKYQLLWNFGSTIEQQNLALNKAVEILTNQSLKSEAVKKSMSLQEHKINVTNFMVWLVENYPHSIKTMMENPDYQYNFK